MQARRTSHGKDAFQGEDSRRLAERLEKRTARRGQKGSTFPEMARARIRPYFINCIATLQVQARILIQSYAWTAQFLLRRASLHLF